MTRRTSSRSGLFLLELIISILFFSVASAICIQLFVKAHIMDNDNRNLTTAVKLTENFAEIYTSVYGDVSALTSFYPEANITISEDYNAQTFSISYHSDWKNSTPEHAAYTLSVSFSELSTAAGALRTAHITILDVSKNTSVHSLDVSVYDSYRGGDSNEK